jgi:Ran GTPase-activating protein (RanGAP) involved in mRNA processing and transport
MSSAEEIAAQQVIQVHDLSEVCEGKFQRVKFDLDLWGHIGREDSGADGAAKLAAAMQSGKCKGLRDLNLRGNEFGADGATELAAAMATGQCPGLRDLNLGDNQIGADGATKLAAAMQLGQCPGLRDLDLRGNEFGADGATKLAAAMQLGQCPGLRDLNLRDNEIGADGAMKLAAAMQSGGCPGLRDMDLYQKNGIDDRAGKNLKELAEALQSGECLELSRAEFVSRALRYPNFVHAPARWSISQHLPRARIVAQDMLSCPPNGTCATRWLVVVLMVVAFCAPALLPADTTSATLTLSDAQNATHTGVFAVTVLSDVCNVVPEELAGF